MSTKAKDAEFGEYPPPRGRFRVTDRHRRLVAQVAEMHHEERWAEDRRECRCAACRGHRGDEEALREAITDARRRRRARLAA